MGTPLLDSAHNHAQSLFVKCLPRTNFMLRTAGGRIVSREKDCVCRSLQCAGLAAVGVTMTDPPVLVALSIRLKGV